VAFDTEDQFGLHQARQKQLSASEKYIANFLAGLDPVTDFILVDCPTCGSSGENPLFQYRHGIYVHCASCDHIYLRNQLSPTHLLDFYKGYPTSSLEWHAQEADFYREIYISGLQLLQPFASSGTLLDIGSSSGFFLSIAADYGYDCCGIEPNQLERAHAEAQGLTIVGSTIDDIKNLGLKYNIITLWDVLEHIQDPVCYLKSIKALLSPGGFLLLQVPTSDSLAARIMRQDCNMFDGLEHLTLFSSRSLDLAFSSAGYSRCSSTSVITDAYAIANYLGYQYEPYLPTGSPQMMPDVIDISTITSSGMGYKIQALYQVCS
jgi:SAM-dependent methyltransferase